MTVFVDSKKCEKQRFFVYKIAFESRFVIFFPPNFVFPHISTYRFFFLRVKLFLRKNLSNESAARPHSQLKNKILAGIFFSKKKLSKERRKLLTAFSSFDRNRLWVQLLMKEEAYQAVTFQCSCCLLKMWE